MSDILYLVCRCSTKAASDSSDRQTEGTSDQVSSTGSNMYCLEVGTAHRCTVGHTIQLNDNALNVYPVRFVQVAPVGGAHL